MRLNRLLSIAILSIVFITFLIIRGESSEKEGLDLLKSRVKTIRSGKIYEKYRYNEVMFKASHNSYERDEEICDQLKWDAEDTYQAGCRGIEFDLNQDSIEDSWKWSVNHDDGYDSEHPSFRRYLRELSVWDRKNPDHDVITVHVDLKNAYGSDSRFAEEFDKVIIELLGQGKKKKFYRPSDLLKRGGEKDLYSSAEKSGWPSIGELKGKFIFVISGKDKDEVGKRKEYYSKNGIDKRIAFVDKALGNDVEIPEKIDYNHRVFMNIDVRNTLLRNKILRKNRKKWQNYCKWAVKHKALITRGWKINESGHWKDAIESGLNIPSTDKVRNHSWATAGSMPFRRIILK